MDLATVSSFDVRYVIAISGVIVALVAIVVMVRLLARQRRSLTNYERLLRFYSLTSRVHQMFISISNDETLLQGICSAATENTGVVLAWISRPGPSGDFYLLAAAGEAIDYLDDIRISSDPDSPHGNGPTARCWREARPILANFKDDARLLPWREHALEFGIGSSANFPIFRDGEPWAVITFYTSSMEKFDSVLTTLLEELCDEISRGLDRLELRRRELVANEFNGTLLESLTVGVNVTRYPERIMERVNRALIQIAGVEDESELVGTSTVVRYADPVSADRVLHLAGEILAVGSGTAREVPFFRKDGALIYLDISGKRLTTADGVERIVWTQIDVTERIEQKRAIEELSVMRDALLSNTVAAIDLVRYPERVVIDANQSCLELLGYEDSTEIVGRSTMQIYSVSEESERMALLAESVLRVGSGSLSNMRIRRKNGEIIYVDMHGRRVEGGDPDHPVIVWTSIEVTKQFHLEEELRRQANFDPLTDLPNRRAIKFHLDAALARGRRSRRSVVVGVIDLDYFKPVNETYGHSVGDELLKKVAQRLRYSLRPTDFAGRIGGDEFVVVLEDVDGGNLVRNLDEIFARLHSVCDAPFDVSGARGIEIGMTMGVAVVTDIESDSEACLRRADLALFRAKRRRDTGGNWWEIAGETVDSAVGDRETESFDGVKEREVLVEIAQWISGNCEVYEAGFYRDLEDVSDIYSGNSEFSEVFRQFISKQFFEFFKFMFDPEIDFEIVLMRCREEGEASGLIGLNASWISQVASALRHRLIEGLEIDLPISVDRYTVLETITTRVERALNEHLNSMSQVVRKYESTVGRPFPENYEVWSELAKEEIDMVGLLPGIKGAELLYPEVGGRFVPLASSGDRARDLDCLLNGDGFDPLIPSEGLSSGVIDDAWRSVSIVRVDDFKVDPRCDAWRRDLGEDWCASMLAIPISREGSVDFVLLIQGSFPSQFASGWMNAFASALRSRWERLVLAPKRNLTRRSLSDAVKMRSLISSGAFEMYMQPIVDLRSGRLAKVEALARIETTEWGVVSPGVFLPILREGELDLLFRHGLNKSLESLREWDSMGLFVDLTINISPLTIAKKEVVDWIVEALDLYEVSPSRLTLELVETEDLGTESTYEIITTLVGKGIHLAIDDLGSGYSSLMRLASLPFDVIKVDQSIVRHANQDPFTTLSLVHTLTQIGQDLKRRVVVEGLENRSIIEAVTILGARYGQGYGIAVPMKASAVVSWASGQWMPPTPNRVTSDLSALAWHLAFMYGEVGYELSPLTSCPVTAYLYDIAFGDDEAFALHALAHEDGGVNERRESGRPFVDWIVRRIESSVIPDARTSQATESTPSTYSYGVGYG